MNEQVDNALGGHGFVTVTSTQVGAVSEPLYTRDELVEIMARAVEMEVCKPYGWTSDQFGTWWYKDNRFTSKQKRLDQAQAAINALLATGQLKVRGGK